MAAPIPLGTLPAVLGCLLLIHLAECVPAAASAEPTCVWYGICSEPKEYKKLNCAYNGSAKPIKPDAMPILQKYCPELAAGGKTCCDTKQLQNLDKSMEPVRNLLARCPSCWENFLKHVCAMTCSPRQSRFLHAVRLETLNETTSKIVELDYYIGETYINTTFESCSKIIFMAPNSTDYLSAIDIMCPYTNCTPQRMFDFFGDSDGNPFVPFQINFKASDVPVDGFIPFNPKTRSCIVGADANQEPECAECIPSAAVKAQYRAQQELAESDDDE